MCILSATDGSPNTSPLFQSNQINSSKIEIVFDLKHFHVSPGSLIKYKAKLPAAQKEPSRRLSKKRCRIFKEQRRGEATRVNGDNRLRNRIKIRRSTHQYSALGCSNMEMALRSKSDQNTRQCTVSVEWGAIWVWVQSYGNRIKIKL